MWCICICPFREHSLAPIAHAYDANARIAKQLVLLTCWSVTAITSEYTVRSKPLVRRRESVV